MRAVVISDTHFGDPASTLARRQGDSICCPRFGDFVDAAGQQNDFLVLLGDIFDFSVSDYADAYAIGAAFFERVGAARVAKEIVFVPGNHDFGFWNIALHEANVINQIGNKQPPKKRWTIPGVLDARTGTATPGLTLASVKPQTVPGKPKYGGLFLDQLTVPPGTGAAPITVNVAFPNVYVVDDTGQTTLLTHGHYFEEYWAYTLHFARRVLGRDLLLKNGDPDTSELVSVNFPLNELASTGLGQSGPLTAVVRKIQSDLRDGKLERVKVYLAAARKYLDDDLLEFGRGGCLKEFLSDRCLGAAIDSLVEALEGFKESPDARNDPGFLDDPQVRANVNEFLRASMLELKDLSSTYDLSIPPVAAVLFGHTHRSIPATAPLGHVFATTGNVLSLYNTGGWLQSGSVTKPDAAVFVYDSAAPGPKWRSIRV